jgi:uncharacterized protein (UPF0335 family)
MAEPSATNGFDPKKMKSFVGRVENVEKELESLKGRYMSECKALREDIKDIFKEAQVEGVPTRPLKNYIKERQLLRKAEACRENLEADDQDSYDLIKQAMGDLAELPLGKAALSTIKGGKSELDDLTATKQ